MEIPLFGAAITARRNQQRRSFVMVPSFPKWGNLKLRMCILIYNDSSYAAEVHFFRRQGYSIDIVQFPKTDIAAIARGYGTRSATVRTVADLDPVRSWVAEGAPSVFVIDGKINPDLEADRHAEHFP